LNLGCGAEGVIAGSTAAEAESLEVAASKIEVEEDLALEGATGKATTSKELSSFEKHLKIKLTQLILFYNFSF
jgi:hypothetical protein